MASDKYRDQIHDALLRDRGGKRNATVLELRADDRISSAIGLTYYEGINEAANEMTVNFVEQGNFIVAVVGSTEPYGVLVGVAKRNPTDEQNWDRGKRLALDRALKSGRVVWLG